MVAATSVSAVSVESDLMRGFGSGGGKSSGLIKTIFICFGGSGGLLNPRKSKPTIATTWTPTVKPSAIAFSLDCGCSIFFITYFTDSVSNPT